MEKSALVPGTFIKTMDCFNGWQCKDHVGIGSRTNYVNT